MLLLSRYGHKVSDVPKHVATDHLRHASSLRRHKRNGAALKRLSAGCKHHVSGNWCQLGWHAVAAHLIDVSFEVDKSEDYFTNRCRKCLKLSSHS